MSCVLPYLTQRNKEKLINRLHNNYSYTLKLNKMKQIIFTLIISIIVTVTVKSQPTFDWAKKVNCNNEIGSVGSIKVDKNGNTILLGMFKGSIAFPTGVITQNNSLNPTQYGVLLAKYDPNGNAIWGYKITTVQSGGGANYFDLQVDTLGNIYTTLIDAAGTATISTSKYSNLGSQIWTKNVIPGPSGQNIGFLSPFIALNKTQTELILTCTIGGGTDADFGNGAIISTGGVCVVHYATSNGNTNKAKKVSASGSPEGIAITNDGSIFIAESNEVYKLNSNDSLLWTKNINSVGVIDIATDGINCFILGNFGGGIAQLDTLFATSNYTLDFFFAKINSAGQSIYIKAGSVGSSGSARADRIAFDKNKSFYILGNSTSAIGNPSFPITTPNEHFILRYDTLGNTIWGSQFNTNLNTSNVYLDRASLTISDSSFVFSSGVYNPTANFGSNALLNNFSTRDCYIFKLNQSSLLPLNLINFSVGKQKKAVVLNWQTSNEINTSHFSIQRSYDGKEFFTIFNLNSKYSNQNIINYVYEDTKYSKNQATIYYRLQMFDKDGSYTYSTIKSINLLSEIEKISIYPNPVKGSNFTLELGIEIKNPIGYTIASVEGKTFLKGNIFNRQQTINLSSLIKGVYIIKLENGLQEKFIKE